ncbi:arginase [Elongatibacter sediminis]|uniref:Arginase n=1 Tax=Elongatibacter sediminis TaxID=3119006 RepID=A0AAW9RH42_9GAMM
MDERTDKTVNIVGVPLDLGASRRGTDMGPSALRIAGLGDALRRLGYRVERESDIPAPAMETRSTEDRKARFKPQILKVCQDLASKVKLILEANEFPLIIGGDHSIAMGTIAGVSSHFRDRGESLGLIWFDAHGDMNIPGVSPSGNIHGMPLAHILGKGDEDLKNIMGFSPKVKPENVALIGIRDIDAGERRIIRESGIHAYTMREIDERGMASIAAEALDVVNRDTGGFHVSFDVDGCDPTVIPGSGTLVPGGVSFREAHLLLEYVADDGRMSSLEVVELNPFLDDRNISAERTLELILSAMGKSIL